MQECTDAGKNLLDLIWVDTDKSVDPAHKNIGRNCATEYKTQRQGQIQRALFVSQFFYAMPLVEAVNVFVSVMMSVGRAKVTVEVDTLRQQQSAFPRNRPETHLCPSSSG